MSTANITRDDAATRSALLTAKAYRVTVDVTGREVADAERLFGSRCELDLTATGGASHLDLIAESVVGAWVDGEQIDASGFDGFRLPLPELTAGDHTVAVEAICRYSRTGEGLHRFVDPVDDKVYLYSQFETADARRMYANLEQPDQKATFSLTVVAPEGWSIFTNGVATSTEADGEGFSRTVHATTPPIPTYITALVAGPYHVVESTITTDGHEIPARVACRASMAEFLDGDRILTTTQRGFEVFENAFGVPYAFDHYDQVFVPEFNAGAMENAGCVTFRDEYLFRSRVTSRELDARDNTILHELAHMWFGDLVTMKWWDDLWLNESFAEWASHFANDEISKTYDTGTNSWASFSNERKTWAYLQDQLSTTHPIAADMSDLEKVEQNFDGITYAKGASVLKLLVSIVGREAFLSGVGNYFRKHAFGNTQLRDLLVELEATSGRDLSWFSGEWLETAGVNTLSAEFDLDHDRRYTRFVVRQSATDEYPTLRTHRLGIGLYSAASGKLERVRYVETDVAGAETSIDELVGQEAADLVLINDGDLTYAKTRMDGDSIFTLVEHIGTLSDPLARSVVWASFWDSLRDGELAPQDYVDLAIAGLPSETDMAAVTTIANQAVVASTRFMAPELREGATRRVVSGLARLLQGAEAGSDDQVVFAKTLVGAAKSQSALELIKGWLDGGEVPEGLPVDTGLRWSIITTLAREGVIGDDEIAAELQRDDTSAGAERAAGARASLPDAEHKAEAWRLATDDPDVANETHRSVAMGFWRYGQDEVLAPYVDRYADVLGAISRREGIWADRGYAAIGTVLRWLFPDTVADEALVERFRTWLADGEPSDQVRRSVSERLDEVERALRVQAISRQYTTN